ncbi:hypothetical protein BU15DRAFT_77429 [Melanogaster broomeanus]|nr:hypothetical protein BU15DRAFT_77429 [Melanogaster broomeanus]
MDPNPRARAQSDFDRVAAWAEVVLLEAGVGCGRVQGVECAYGMGTRDEIIIQFPVGTEVFPLLGEHHWAAIAKRWTGSTDHSPSSCVFIYNWRNNGDPAHHNWTEYYPNPLPPGSVPSKSPYPPPTWACPPPRLTKLVHSLPRPPTPPPLSQLSMGSEIEHVPPALPPPPDVTPTHMPESEEGSQSKGMESPRQETRVPVRQPENTSLFRQYQPPYQHPVHAHFLSQNQQHVPTSAEPIPEPKFIKKLDPYEMEEDALEALRSFKSDPDHLQDCQDHDVKPVLPLAIKPDTLRDKVEEIHTNTVPGNPPKRDPSPTYQPTRDPRKRPRASESFALSTLVRVGSSLRNGFVTPPLPPPASLGYQPSAELEAAISSLLQCAPAASTSASSTTTTNNQSRTTPVDPRGSSGKISAFSTALVWLDDGITVNVKREFVKDEPELSGASGKKIKLEES